MPAPPKQRLSWNYLLAQWMMGTLLGVVCAGMLLRTHLPQIPDFASLAARLEFLIGIGFSFGLGAMLTGVVLLLSEQSQS